jgi:exonuclease SbcC
VEEAKAALARRVGFDPELPVVALDRFVRRAEKVDAARAQIREAEIEIERVKGEIAGLAGAVAAFLSEWGEGVAPGPDAFEPAALFAGPPETVLEPLDAGLHRLSARCRTVREGRRDIAEADSNLARIEEDLGRLSGEAVDIFAGVGLEPGAREVLEERLRALDAFRERMKGLQETRIREAQIRSGLEGEEALLALVASDDQEGLTARLDQTRREEKEREELKEQLTAIRTRLQSTGTDRRLEEALARREVAHADLEEARERALQAAAGRFLLEEVKAGHRAEHEPAVLQDARERFERFTRHGWSLELDERDGFAARDLEQGERRGLSELSSATRMQLLLAARMAWTRHLEAGRETLPFFLDEALTTSDPERFHEVASSIISLIEEEGRQVFYLCAQPTDVQLWARTLGRVPRVIDLGAVRFGRPSETAAVDFELPERAPIPAPEDLSAAEYAAALGVGPVDPWEDPGGVHIFHVIRDDLHLLHRLLVEWGVSVLGPLEVLLSAPVGVLAVPEEEQRRRLAERCRAARCWIEAWREGRGRPVDRPALEASGVVSTHFIDAVSSLADEVGGDPHRLIDRLSEIPRWGKAKTLYFIEWLEESGHLDPRGRLNGPGRESHVLRELAGRAEPEDLREVVRWLEAGLVQDREPSEV